MYVDAFFFFDNQVYMWMFNMTCTNAYCPLNIAEGWLAKDPADTLLPLLVSKGMILC
jgi:hypothetical protein